MINVNVLEVNDPRRATLVAKAEKQAAAYEKLFDGRRSMTGNAWDPWNVIGISWSIYNDFKNKGYSDEKIANVVNTSKKFDALIKMKLRIENYKSLQENIKWQN